MNKNRNIEITDYFLKANTEQELYDALPNFMKMLNEGNIEILQTHSHKWAFDWDIPIEITPGVFDNSEPPVMITPPVMSDKFHANLRLIEPDLGFTIGGQYKINPISARRRFA